MHRNVIHQGYANSASWYLGMGTDAIVPESLGARIHQAKRLRLRGRAMRQRDSRNRRSTYNRESIFHFLTKFGEQAEPCRETSPCLCKWRSAFGTCAKLPSIGQD